MGRVVPAEAGQGGVVVCRRGRRFGLFRGQRAASMNNTPWPDIAMLSLTIGTIGYARAYDFGLHMPVPKVPRGCARPAQECATASVWTRVVTTGT